MLPLPQHPLVCLLNFLTLSNGSFLLGVASCHIGGTTLHQFAGIGTGEVSLKRCIELASRPASATIWRKCKHLIIDEISMIDGDYFEVQLLF